MEGKGPIKGLNMLGLVISLLTILSFAQSPGFLEITRPLEFKQTTISGKIGPKALEGLYDLSVKMGKNRDNAHLEMSSSEGQKKVVDTCREYDQAKEAKMQASTTFSKSMESFFKHTCTMLDALLAAKPIMKNEKTLTLAKYTALPVGLMVNRGKDDKRTTLGEYAEDKDFKVVSSSDHELIFEFAGIRTHLMEAARADFNKSGKEQVLVFKADHALKGSYRHYEFYLLVKEGDQVSAKVVN